MANGRKTPRDVESQALISGSRRSFLRISTAEIEGAALVMVWMVISCVIVMMNKWIYTAGGFPYPLALTAMHMAGCLVIFGSVRLFAPSSVRKAIMPDADVVVTWPQYFKMFVMISVFFAVSIGAGNMAYLYSSVAFLQMMKPMTSVTSSLAAFAIGVDVPTSSHIIIVSTIAFGIFAATGTATSISMAGVALQLLSSSADGCRLALVQSVMSSGLKFDPVTTVYHFSFACSLLLALASLAWERPYNLDKLYSPWMLVGNVALAVLLNVIVATAISKTSAVAFALSGSVKDMAIVIISGFAFGEYITIRQWCGYSLALSGLLMFRQYKDNVAYFKQHGFIKGIRLVTRGSERPSDEIIGRRPQSTF